MSRRAHIKRAKILRGMLSGPDWNKLVAKQPQRKTFGYCKAAALAQALRGYYQD